MKATIKCITAMFRKRSVYDIAAKELEEAQRSLLGHQRSEEFHAHMIQYYETKITRLDRMLTTEAVR